MCPWGCKPTFSVVCACSWQQICVSMRVHTGCEHPRAQKERDQQQWLWLRELYQAILPSGCMLCLHCGDNTKYALVEVLQTHSKLNATLFGKKVQVKVPPSYAMQAGRRFKWAAGYPIPIPQLEPSSRSTRPQTTEGSLSRALPNHTSRLKTLAKVFNMHTQSWAQAPSTCPWVGHADQALWLRRLQHTETQSRNHTCSHTYCHSLTPSYSQSQSHSHSHSQSVSLSLALTHAHPHFFTLTHSHKHIGSRTQQSHSQVHTPAGRRVSKHRSNTVALCGPIGAKL